MGVSILFCIGSQGLLKPMPAAFGQRQNGWIASLLQGKKQPFAPTENLQFRICLTCMFWDCGWKPEYPEWTHADLQTPHRKVPRAWGWTRHFLTVGWQCYCPFLNCSTVLFLLFRNTQLSKLKTLNYGKEKGNWTVWVQEEFAGNVPARAPTEPHCLDEEAIGTGSEQHRWENTNAHLHPLCVLSDWVHSMERSGFVLTLGFLFCWDSRKLFSPLDKLFQQHFLFFFCVFYSSICTRS